jgi:hypothetical protein
MMNMPYTLGSTTPKEYRLARRLVDGRTEVVLQGLFHSYGKNQNGESFTASEWRDIPIVDLPA